MPMLDRFESLLRRFAVPGITAKIIAAQVFFFFVYVLRTQQGAQGHPLDPFYLYMDKVAGGEVWRLFTFLIMPPVSPRLDGWVIFVLFYWSLLYTFGTALEHEWGTARYNLYLWIGYLANLVGSLLLWWAWGFDGAIQNGFLYASVFLAFARYYPDYTLYIMLFLPMKVKWLAWLQGAMYALSFAFGDAPTRIIVLASSLNYLLFFWREQYRSYRHRRRKQAFQTSSQGVGVKQQHECHVCGLTSSMSPKTLFRYCTKCEGDLYYCPEHIGNHEHLGAAPEKVEAEE